jgi:DNA-binding NarL/FixJ family response regulator
LTGASEPALVGRARELQTIAERRTAGGVGFALVGAPGVGKTRLARAALADAARAGATPLWVQATRSASSVPLGALAGVLPDRYSSDDPLTVLRTSAHALTELAGRKQLVLGVDDAQHLDETSAALLLHLARTSTSFILVTVRVGEPCPDAIRALWKDAGAYRLVLGALDEASTEELLEEVLGGPAESGLRHWIWELGRGNAMYVTELVAGLLTDQALSCDDGLWRVTGRARVPASLTELVSDRIAGLHEGVRRSLELLALGEPLRLSVLSRLESHDALAAAEAEGLITVDESSTDPWLRLSRPLYGEAICAALPVLRARQIRLQLAEATQQDAPLSAEASLRVARWLTETGEPVPHALLVDAARAAIATGAPELGGRLAQTAAERGGGVEAQMLLARSLAVRNRFDEAAAVLAGAEPLIADPETGMAYLQQQTTVLYWGLNRVADLRALLARARGWWPDVSWHRRVDPLSDLITAHLPGEQPSAGVKQSSILSDATDSDPQRQRTLQTAQLRRLAYEARGREAYRLGASLRPTVPFRDVYDQNSASLWVGVCVQSGEGLEELERWCQKTVRAAVRHDDHSAAGVAALGLGSLRYLEGRFREAGRWLSEAQLHYQYHDPFGLLVVTHASQVAVAAATGDTASAAAALLRCRAAVRGEPPPPTQLPHLRWAEGWAAVAAGEEARGGQILLDGALEVAVSPLDAAFLGYEALRAGVPAPVVASLLESLDAHSDARLITGVAAHATALVDGDATNLLEAAEQLEAIGALRFACEAAADAAECLLAEGEESSARRAAARSRRLFADDQGAQMPPVSGLSGSDTTLSGREAEIAALAALGLSNAEIADRLVLSVRTVETYVYRAMQKLGLGDRRDLAGAIDSSPAERRIAS